MDRSVCRSGIPGQCIRYFIVLVPEVIVINRLPFGVGAVCIRIFLDMNICRVAQLKPTD